MNPLNPEELALLNGLIHGQHISKDQSIKVLEGLNRQSKQGFPLSLEELLLKSNLVSLEIINSIKNQKSPNEETLNVSLQDLNTVDSELVSSHSNHYEYLKDFKFDRTLGSGALGDSYLGELKGKGRVVLKVLKNHFLKNSDYISSVQRNLEEIDYQSHENLIPFSQIKGDDDQVFYWSPYLDESSIGGTLRSRDRLEINDAISIAISIAEVLKFFERINRPHLALDEENVFITEEGNIILKDFEWNRDFFNTKSDRIGIGPSMNYMSPEYIRGGPVSFHSDMYSLGALLFYMLTKKPVLTGNFEAQLLKKENEIVPDITEIRRDVPLTINTVIQKTLAFDPQNRYKSFEELIGVLSEILEKRTKQIRASQRKVVKEKVEISDELIVVEPVVSDMKASSKVASELRKKRQKNAIFYWLSLVFLLLGLVIYLFSNLKNTNDNKPEPVVNKPQKLSVEPVILGNEGVVPPEVKISKENWSTKDVENLVSQELSRRMKTLDDKNKFSKRSTALNVIRENLSEKGEVPRDVLNRVVEFHQEKLSIDRESYWGIKKGILNRSFDKVEIQKIKNEIKLIRKETENDEYIEQQMANLIAKKTIDNPDLSHDFLISPEVKQRAVEITRRSLPHIRNHAYKKLEELYLNESVREKNRQQRKSYQDEIEFYEHATKVKDFISNQNFTKSHLLRSLGLDEDGDVASVSSKGLHVKNGEKGVIPWDKISSRVLSMLASKYKPKTLGDNISLLIYAKRAGNHIVMKMTLKEIERKYKAAYQSPLVKEIEESIKDLESTLVSEWINQQISLAKKLKSKNNNRGDREAKMVLDELSVQYYSHPLYQKNKIIIKNILVEKE